MTKLTNPVAILIMAVSLTGCTSLLTQQQGKHWPGYYQDCPSVYMTTRMELSSLAWAFSDDKAPADSCLAHYYPKAGKDAFYSDVNKYLIPAFILSLPADVLVDTITLPFAAW